jgi:hypothetical protein
MTVSTVDPCYHEHMVPRRAPLRKNHECSGCIKKLLQFTYTAHLAVHNLKPHGVDYIIVTKITVVHSNAAHQKIDAIPYSLSQIYIPLIHFPHNVTQLLLKTCNCSTDLIFSI